MKRICVALLCITLVMLPGIGVSIAAPADLGTLYVVAPFSGNLKDFGAQIRVGVSAAVAEASAKPPGDFPLIRVEYFDDECQAGKAARIAGRLVSEGARVVLGHVCSVASMPASDIYAAAGVPMLSAASSNSTLTERGLTTVFRVAGRDDDQAPLAAATIAHRYPGKRVAVVEEDDLTGKGHGERLIAALGRRKITPELVMTISGPQDIAAVVLKLIRNDAQVVFYGGHQASQFGQLLKAARVAGFQGQFISNDGAGNKLVWETAESAAEGVLFTFDRDYRHSPDARVAVVRIRSMGSEPAGFTLNAFASTQILLQTLAANRAASGPKLSDYMHHTVYHTVIGDVRFNDKGDLAESKEGLFRWHDGQAVPE